MKSLIGSLLTRVENSAPVPYVGRNSSMGLFGGNPAQTGNPVAQMRAMGSVGTLFSIVNRTTNATAQVTWRLYRKEKKFESSKVERTEVDTHPALEVWRRPNPFMPQQEFVEVSQQHVDLVGETFWIVGRKPDLPGMPLELWPVRPDHMTHVPHPTKFLTGWIYKDPDGKDIPLRLEDVIHLRMPNPLDPYRGMGPVQALMVDLDSVKYSAEWNRNFFLNSAAPGGIIEVDKRLSDEEFNEFQQRWEEGHRGVSKAHRVAMVEQGKWVNRAFSQRDMQFAELRNVSRNVIMEAFGIHKHLLGIAEDVNRANAEAAAYAFARWLIQPRLERIKAVLNNEFLPLFGSLGTGVYFDYESPVEEDGTAANLERDSKVAAATQMVQAGWDDKEVLQWLELPPMKYEKPEVPAPVMPGGEGKANGSKPGAQPKQPAKPASPAKP